MTTSDYASTISPREDGRFNFRWPTLLFGRAGRDGATRNDATMRVGGDNASVHSVQGYLDEKNQHEPHYPPPVLLEPAPVQLEARSIRKSLASWFRASPGGGSHPLKFHPMSRWSRSTTRSAAGGDGTVPPMPDLDLQRSYAGRTTSMTTGTPSNPAELASVYTPGDDESLHRVAAPYTSHWSASSLGSSGIDAGAGASAGDHARASMVSSWTSGTRSTMQGEQERDSRATGLSPPAFYLGGGSSSSSAGSTVSELSAGPVETLSIGSGGVSDYSSSSSGSSQGRERLTNLHEELLELYAQGESAAVVAEQERPQAAGKQGDGPPRL